MRTDPLTQTDPHDRGRGDVRGRRGVAGRGLASVLAGVSFVWIAAFAVHAGGDPVEAPRTDDAPPTPVASGRDTAGSDDADAPESRTAAESQKPNPSAEERRIVAAFSDSDGSFTDVWKPLEFEKIPRHTRYTFEREGNGWVVRADAQASASGMTRKIDIDLEQFPILRWRWKVEGVLEKGDVSRKSGDDYPARIYVAFKYEPERVGFLRKAQYNAGRVLFGDIPIGAINYIWASRAKRGEIYDNPFAGSFVKMIAVESGPERAGEWVEEQRNVYEDYVQAFGEEPPPVEGVAIMTDTDNTAESATAWYGDIEFLSRAATD